MGSIRGSSSARPGCKLTETQFIMFLVAACFPAADARADFPIATGSAAIGFAFDGTNYLVGIEDHSTTVPSIGAQRIDASGAKVGSVISTGRNGISAYTAWFSSNPAN